jgi:hypothetical protein
MTNACFDDHLVTHRDRPGLEGWNKTVNVLLHVCQTDGIRDGHEGTIERQQDIVATYRMTENRLLAVVMMIAEGTTRSDLYVRLQGESTAIKESSNGKYCVALTHRGILNFTAMLISGVFKAESLLKACFIFCLKVC